MPDLLSSIVSEKALIHRTRSGSMEALGELYARYAEQMYRVLLRILGSPAEAEDVLQDVFVGLPNALRQFDEERDLGPWLVRIAGRVALSRLRSREQRTRRERIFADEFQSEHSSPSIVQRLRLEHALDALPEPLRAVLLLKEVEGYSHDEIADLLEITPGASAVRLHRALKRLREELRRSE